MNIREAKKLDLVSSAVFSSVEKHNSNEEREPDDILIERLMIEAKKAITAGQKIPYRHFEYEEEDSDGKIVASFPMLYVAEAYEKLFEGRYVKNVSKSKVEYIFTKIVGYDEYFSAPVIILRDSKGDVVDLVKYRPHRDGYGQLPKYLQKKAKDKPKDRGEAYLYPFQIEMERLIAKEGYVFVGEGLKNGLNALLRSVPFISIESASNTNNPRLIEYVNTMIMEGIDVYGAMDGDEAGRRALNSINSKLNGSLINLMDFESGIDFSEYLKKDHKWN